MRALLAITLAVLPCLAVAEGALPSTTHDVFRWSLIATTPSGRTLEGLVWTGPDGGVFCASNQRADCVGAFEPTQKGGVNDISFLCDDGMAGTIFVDGVEKNFGLAPRRAFGRTDKSEQLIVLFGPFRTAKGAVCASLKADIDLPVPERKL